MRDGETCTQGRAMATIKGKELIGVPIMQRMHDVAAQIFAGPRSAKAFALDAQERDLIERIDYPQLCIEFQTIDDADRVTEPNICLLYTSDAADE